MKSLAAASMIVSCLALMTTAVRAQQDFPRAPVKLVVPYSAGGPVDVVARALSDKLADRWKQRVLVDNRPGADESIGATAVAKAPSDGYTLFLGTEQSLVLNQFMHAKLSYDAQRELMPVSRVSYANYVFVVPVTSSAKTLSDWVKIARTEPGKVTYGWAGVNRLPMIQFAKLAGVQVTYAGYKGLAPMLPDLISGRLDSVMAVESGVSGLIQEGKLRGLAITGGTRSPALPQVPTFKEAGFPAFDTVVSFGLMAPSGTPMNIVNRIAADVKEAMRSAEMARMLEPIGFVAVGDSSAEFGAFLRTKRQQAAEQLKQAGIQPE